MAQPDVVSVIAPPPLPEVIDADRFGEFLPESYSWRLPERHGSHIVYLGGRNTLTARMLRVALLRRVRSVVYWGLDDWRQRSILVLAVAKLSGRLLGMSVTISIWLTRKLVLLVKRIFGRVPGVRTLQAWALRRLQSENALRRQITKSRHGSNYRRLLGPKSAALRLRESFCTGRVLMACPTLVAGGAERQIVNTALGLRDRGLHDLTIVVTNLHSRPGHDFFYDTLVNAGIDVRELEGPTTSSANWEYYRSPSVAKLTSQLQVALKGLPSGLAQEVADLYLTISHLRPAIVHAWLDYSSVAAGLAALLAGVPRVLLSGRNVSPMHFPHFHQPYMRPAYQAMARRPEVVWVNNSHGGAADYARWLRLPVERFNIVYNGIDPATAVRASDRAIADFRRRSGIPSDAVVVGGMFRLSDEKRPVLWIETLARVLAGRRNTYGLLFGSGQLRGVVEEHIARAGLTERIRVLPPTTAHALALSAFDILLLTSRWEGTPNVVIEAQSVATPVVSCGGGGAAEALSQGETGLYVERAEPEALAAAVQRLLDDPGYRQRLGAAGPEFARSKFGLERMISETLALYDLKDDCTPRHRAPVVAPAH